MPGIDTPLSGCVFIPGRFAPITAENDVAPQVSMIKGKDIPIPSFNPKAWTDNSVPRQSTKQFVKPKPFTFEDQVLATAHSGVPVSLGNLCATAMVPIADASREVKEPSACDVGATIDLQPITEPIKLVSAIKNTDKEVTTGQQAVTPVTMLNELIHDEPKNSNIELNQTLLSAEPESMPSEHISKSSVEKQACPKTDILHKTKTKLGIETPREADNSNSNGGPSGDVFDKGSNPALETGEAVPSESKFASGGSDFLEKSGSSFGGVADLNANQPNESFVNSVKPENPTGTETILEN